MEPPVESFSANDIVELVRVRDEITEMEKRQKEELKPLQETRMQLEQRILGHLTKVGAQNISTSVATASILTRKTASLADPAAFMKFVIANSAWDLIDRKANAKAVEDFIAQHHSAPPGVNYSQMQVLGLRRK